MPTESIRAAHLAGNQEIRIIWHGCFEHASVVLDEIEVHSSQPRRRIFILYQSLQYESKGFRNYPLCHSAHVEAIEAHRMHIDEPALTLRPLLEARKAHFLLYLIFELRFFEPFSGL